MKKYIIIILLLFTINIDVYAQISIQDNITAIENTLFGYDYQGETDEKRVERIEKNLYGQKKNGDLAKRVENIKNDSGLTFSKTPSLKNDSNSSNTYAKKDTNIPELKEDATVEYPIVDKMEEEIFKTTYKNENIYSRLNRLEQSVFNKTSNEDLNSRVDKLASVIRPKTKRMYQQNNYAYSSDDLDAYYNNNGFEPVNDQSMPFQLSALEEDLLRNSYNNDNTSNRLSRLEQKLFNRTFVSDSDVTRLQRIMVAYDAKKNSYKYENNRKMQNMATMSQLGGILLMILAILL